MNAQQKEAIEDALNEELGTRPDVLPLLDASRPEPFFIKALEDVQGDERDVMVISIGYSKDSTWHLTQNFGPINMAGHVHPVAVESHPPDAALVKSRDGLRP